MAHYESDIIVENLMREIDGEEPLPESDGHSTCFIVTGYEKASLIDFNYKLEPAMQSSTAVLDCRLILRTATCPTTPPSPIAALSSRVNLGQSV